MAAFNLPAFPSFDIETDKSNAGPRCKKWVDRLENFFIGLDIDDEDRKRALLLHYAGERVYDIYDAYKKQTLATKVCRQRHNPRQEKVRDVQDNTDNNNYESSSDEEYAYHISMITPSREHVVGSKTPRPDIRINDKHCNFLLDTGATVNLLDQKTYHKIGAPKMKKGNNPNLLPYGGSDPLKFMGQCQLSVETKSTINCDTFYVVQGNHGVLLGYPLASKLGLVRIINQITDPKAKYPKLFEGIGKYKGKPIKLHIDENVKPVAQRHRRTPFHLRDKVEKELIKLKEQDIIDKIEGTPTPWVSPILTPPKKNPEEIRLCVDMRQPNKAISRERHLLPTIDELIQDLTGAILFTKLDLRSGYHQLELRPSSRYITTFSTHAGLFCYKRLNFGISSASEIFQEVIRNVISGIPGVKNISDDIIIYGKSQAEHDKALDATFKRLLENGLTLNLEKCEFNKDQVVFFGVTFSKEGISPDPKKVSAIKDMSPPKNVPELRSFRGITTY
ncbi:unnamed protein product [Mytilus coruscus]|uniref:Reverse transcriptase domain-containing protein n=1 Tax=Mytilus coruscus TaxID=42192 RepID=A0A6J8F4T1_MYTCO|nr:unnamed protein product [Mytilus coruscus]